MKYDKILYLGCVLFLIIACKSAKISDKITVFCAAGLADVMEEVKDTFNIDDPISIQLNIASSGTLARQIALGNTCDIYISANNDWAEYVDSIGSFCIKKGLFQDRLAFIAPKASRLDSVIFRPESIPELERYLSIGDPDHVPAGKYAKQALKNIDWWADWEKRLLPAKDVRSALMPVEMNECGLGIVYLSDALSSSRIKILGIFPDSLHTPIIFTAMLACNASPKAHEFFAFLNTVDSIELAKRMGLQPLSVTE